MEKGSNRILGYQLASNLPNEELEKINGGALINNMSFKKCFNLSGSSVRSLDGQYDVTVDC